MFTNSCFCLTEADSKLRFDTNGSRKLASKGGVLSVISNQLIDTGIDCGSSQLRLSDSHSFWVVKILPSRRDRSFYLFVWTDQLIVVDGVVAFPPVCKPIASAIADSSSSRCLRKVELVWERAFCFSSRSCHSVELAVICWFSLRRVCWFSLICFSVGSTRSDGARRAITKIAQKNDTSGQLVLKK